MEDPQSTDICFGSIQWRSEFSRTKASAICGDALSTSANSSRGRGVFLAEIQSARHQRVAEKVLRLRFNTDSRVNESTSAFIWTGLRINQCKRLATVNSTTVVWVDARSGQRLNYTNFGRKHVQADMLPIDICVVLSREDNYTWVPWNCTRPIGREALCAARPGLGKECTSQINVRLPFFSFVVLALWWRHARRRRGGEWCSDHCS